MPATAEAPRKGSISEHAAYRSPFQFGLANSLSQRVVFARGLPLLSDYNYKESIGDTLFPGFFTANRVSDRAALSVLLNELDRRRAAPRQLNSGY